MQPCGIHGARCARLSVATRSWKRPISVVVSTVKRGSASLCQSAGDAGCKSSVVVSCHRLLHCSIRFRVCSSSGELSLSSSTVTF
jgi:hypothetical protein